jgi:hypothetical protein
MNIAAELLEAALCWFALNAAALVLLYWIYAAVGNWQGAHARGKLSQVGFLLALPWTIFGVVLDYFINVNFMSVVCLDVFHWGTVSQRLKKYHADPTEHVWRRWIAGQIKPLVDPLDPAGEHI